MTHCGSSPSCTAITAWPDDLLATVLCDTLTQRLPTPVTSCGWRDEKYTSDHKLHVHILTNNF